MNDTTAAAVTSRADVPTDQPARYVKQLISHLGRKLDVTTDGPVSTAAVGAGTGQVVADNDLAAAGKRTGVCGGHRRSGTSVGSPPRSPRGRGSGLAQGAPDHLRARGPGRAGSLRRAAARSTPWALAGADDRR